MNNMLDEEIFVPVEMVWQDNGDLVFTDANGCTLTLTNAKLTIDTVYTKGSGTISAQMEFVGRPYENYSNENDS